MCVFLLALCVWSVRPLLGSVHNYRADIQRKRCNPVKVRVCVCMCCGWPSGSVIYNGGRPKLTFHRASVISQGMMGTECAAFFST